MTDKTKKAEPGDCFIIMPISDSDGYPSGHFGDVFDVLISPSVLEAGYKPVRADGIHAANMIHIDIVRRILDSPLAICDLSSLNPNVMFELGIRQSFDRPVILLKDERTRSPFDIAPIRYIEYDSNLSFKSVMASRARILKSITETLAGSKTGDTNSIVKLLGVQAAALREGPNSPEDARLTLILEEIGKLNGKISELETRGAMERTSSQMAADAMNRYSRDLALRRDVEKMIANRYSLERMKLDDQVETVQVAPGTKPEVGK